MQNYESFIMVAAVFVTFFAGLEAFRQRSLRLKMACKLHDAVLQLSDFAARYSELKKRFEMHVSLEPREVRKIGFFSETHVIEVFQTYYFGGLAVGEPRLIRRESFSKVNQENVKAVLDNVVQPLMSAGIKVAIAAVA